MVKQVSSGGLLSLGSVLLIVFTIATVVVKANMNNHPDFVVEKLKNYEIGTDEDFENVVKHLPKQKRLLSIGMHQGKECKTIKKCVNEYSHILQRMEIEDTGGKQNDMTKSKKIRKEFNKNYRKKMRGTKHKKNKNNEKKDSKNNKKSTSGKSEKKLSRTKRGIMFDFDNLPNRMFKSPIGFVIDPDVGEDHKRDIQSAMLQLEALVSMRFQPETTNPNPGQTYMRFIADNQCESFYGRVYNQLYQNISSNCGGDGENMAIHEILHALGYMHEQQSLLRKMHLYVMPENIHPDWSSAFDFKDVGSVYKYSDNDTYGLSSPLHYESYYSSLSKDGGILFQVPDKNERYMVGDITHMGNLYYTIRDLADLYNVAGTTCNTSAIDCSLNEGFLIDVDGECKCKCPTGLDPANGCNSSEPTYSPTTVKDWPDGDYATIETEEGCPSEFDKGWITISPNGPFKPSGNFDANISSTDNASDDNEFKINFCVRNSSNAADPLTFPKGSYCILKGKVNDCPTDFNEGSIRIVTSTFSSWGFLPDIDHTTQVANLSCCCRQDRHWSVEAVFPYNNHATFTLLAKGRGCQEIKGMMSSAQRFFLHNSASEGQSYGDTPYLVKDANKGVYLNFCYYTPVSYDCGGKYTLTTASPSATISSSSPYLPNHRCLWLITAEADSQIILNFTSFDIAQNSDGTSDDILELRLTLLGRDGERRHGYGMFQTYVSDSNTAAVILHSNKANEAGGFVLNASMKKRADLCYSGTGKNYVGQRNVSVDFQPCLNWSEVKCKYNSSSYSGDVSLDKNYCRNPNDLKRPWCYVDTDCTIGYCDVCNLESCYDTEGTCNTEVVKERFCNNHGEKCKKTCGYCNECYDMNDANAYSGTVHTTSYGQPCQTWTEEFPTPYSYNYADQDFPSGSKVKASNYCRSPDYDTEPWCQIDDNGSDNWDYCGDNILICDSEGNPPANACISIADTNSTWCEEKLNSMKPFCDRSESLGCADTCGLCQKLKNETEPKNCSAPTASTVYSPIQTTYVSGAVVTLTCNTSTEILTQTCSTAGDWIPQLTHVCGAGCPPNFIRFGDVCYHYEPGLKTKSEAESFCSGIGANILTEKDIDKTAVVGNLRDIMGFNGPIHSWIALSDAAEETNFTWYDNTTVTFTNWAPAEPVSSHGCRIINRPDYSFQTETKDGVPCANWSGSPFNSIGNVCSSFGLMDRNLWCYTNTITGANDWCDVPLCQPDNPAFRAASNFDASQYIGLHAVSKNGNKCVDWADQTDYDDASFADGSRDAAKNYCRYPNGSTGGEVWCYTSMVNGIATNAETCDDPSVCSTDVNECRTIRTTYGNPLPIYRGTKNIARNNETCLQWSATSYNSDSYFPYDDSAEDAMNYCRPVQNKLQPGCMTSSGYQLCDVDNCCQETGYTRPEDYTGKRWFTSNNKRCKRWTDVPNLPYSASDFPDSTIAAAENYCRSPGDGSDYLFCYMNDNTAQYCDVPMEEDIADCVVHDDSGKWINSYCDDYYPVICEKETESYTQCSDQDNEKCEELFTLFPAKCRDSQTWEKSHCRRTCGYCTGSNPTEPNTETCSAPTLGANVIKVTTTTTVKVGEYFQFACASGYHYFSGNLERGCLPGPVGGSPVLTGQSPVCTVNGTDVWTNDNYVKQRKYSDHVNNKIIFGNVSNHRVKANGFWKGVHFFPSGDGVYVFYVCRYDTTSQSYKIIASVMEKGVLAGKAMEVNLEMPESVQAGDLIGWNYIGDGNNGISYDACNLEYHPAGLDGPDWYISNGLVEGSTQHVYNPPEFKTFTTGCRIYAIKALTGPIDP